MPIDGALRDKLEPETKLVARYKGAEHTAEVVAGEDGKVRYRLADGREFTSPSAAGRAVMGGTACNGWRFWSIAGDEPKQSRRKAGSKPASEAAERAS